MPDIATVIVEALHTHSAPGGDETIIGSVKNGDQFVVLERVTRPMAVWLRVRSKGNGEFWIAERNRHSGAVFATVGPERIDPPPREPVIITQPVPFPWWALYALGAGLVTVFLAWLFK